jgi:hypothetical protein
MQKFSKFIKISPSGMTKWNYFIQKEAYLNTSLLTKNTVFEHKSHFDTRKSAKMAADLP